ncbi:N-acetylglucosamine-6-phosphate deacetylase [Streptomyces sulfonofaciens]|uniref:N-acetylglucosamine-6-phosphate deacetylase n=1 Tax=Streptomyces sulfonofaciens TaxID=68272 RepID=A0A919KZD7_9ACTN|nr:N-acetylglucosamine-6-phosphate deacetylase [Streptomyces sulfonofaciens]GHH79090.1 N-acetylglucosamine-6-phosphate deacetylase [Streptomyces sulfonofaciens]
MSPARPAPGGDRLLANARLVTPGRVTGPGWLLVRDGLIAALGEGRPPAAADGAYERSGAGPGAPGGLGASGGTGAPGAGAPGGRGTREVVDLGGRLLTPGFVDAHCHGGAGHSVYTGDRDDVRAAAAGHLARGTTTMLASVATVAPRAMTAAVRAIAAVIADGTAPTVAGIHLEGPFLSPDRRGAQTRTALRAPDEGVLRRLLDAAEGHAVSMTLAPELPGALDLIRGHAGDLVCCLGHTDASAGAFAEATDLGARAVTHLFNAMPPLHHREPGPVAAALLDARLRCELILDGHHLAVDTARLAYRLAGPERLLLVSDAMPAAGMADGDYRFADREVTVTDGVARLRGTDTLAGSTLFVAAAFRRAVLDVGIPVPDAVLMAATTPAALLGLTDRGALRPGLRADLVALDERLRPARVWLAGEEQPVAQSD